jgi:predicted DNA-binding protein
MKSSIDISIEREADMKMPKKQISFRLSQTTVKELEILAKKHQVSQADVISVIIHAVSMGWDMDDLDDYFEVARL